MPVDRDALAALHSRLTEQLAELTRGDDWLKFLKDARQFHRYSPQNQLLLLMQGAHGHVASYRTWQRIPAEGGGTCQVRRGEQGLVVLAPMKMARTEADTTTGEEKRSSFVRFKPVKVFHQGQLVDPPALATPPLPKLLRGENRYHHVWAAAQSRLEERGFAVDKVSRSPVETWNGRTHFGERTVVVSDHLEPPAALKTLLHEWAHVVLSHDVRLAGRAELREVEAESAAYLVCGTIGVDSADYSVPYLASWSDGDGQLLQDTAQMALAAAATMIGELERELSIDLTPSLSAAHDRQAATQLDTRRATIDDNTPPVTAPGPAAEVHAALTALMTEPERERLLAALADLDNQLAEAVELLANAGFDTPRTARLLSDRGVNATQLVPAMIRDAVEHHPDREHLGHDDVGLLAAEVHAAVQPSHSAPHRPGFARLMPNDQLELVTANDRLVLQRLITSGHHTDAGRVLADAGLNIGQARDVLHSFNLSPAAIEAVVTASSYNPATRANEPLWLDSAPPAATRPDPSVHVEIPSHDAIHRAAATGDATRLVYLSEAYGLRPEESIRIWARAGLAAEVVARAATAVYGEERANAAATLAENWPGEPVDWNLLVANTHTGQNTTAVSTTESILREWQLASQTASAGGAAVR